MNKDWSSLARRFAQRTEEPEPSDTPRIEKRVAYAGVIFGAFASFSVPGIGFTAPFWAMALVAGAGGVAATSGLWAVRSAMAVEGLPGAKEKTKGFARAMSAQAKLGWAWVALVPRMALILPGLCLLGVISMRKGLENAPESVKNWVENGAQKAEDAIEGGKERQAIALGPKESWRMARRCALDGRADRIATLFLGQPFDPRWPMPATPRFAPRDLLANDNWLDEIRARHEGKEISLDRALDTQTQIMLRLRPWLADKAELLAETTGRARALREGIEIVRATQSTPLEGARRQKRKSEGVAKALAGQSQKPLFSRPQQKNRALASSNRETASAREESDLACPEQESAARPSPRKKGLRL